MVIFMKKLFSLLMMAVIIILAVNYTNTIPFFADSSEGYEYLIEDDILWCYIKTRHTHFPVEYIIEDPEWVVLPEHFEEVLGVQHYRYLDDNK